jgi:hypothetical protein
MRKTSSGYELAAITTGARLRDYAENSDEQKRFFQAALVAAVFVADFGTGSGGGS